MKKQFISHVVFVMLVVLKPAAYAQQDMIDYAGAGMAIQSVSNFDMGMTIVANAGKQLNSVYENFSVESEITYSLLAPSTGAAFIETNMSIFSLAGYAVYSYPIDAKIAVRGRAGLLYERVSSHICISSVCDDVGTNSFGLTVGAGGIYSLSKTLSLTADWTLIEGDVFNFGAGAKYSF